MQGKTVVASSCQFRARASRLSWSCVGSSSGPAMPRNDGRADPRHVMNVPRAVVRRKCRAKILPSGETPVQRKALSEFSRSVIATPTINHFFYVRQCRSVQLLLHPRARYRNVMQAVEQSWSASASREADGLHAAHERRSQQRAQDPHHRQGRPVLLPPCESSAIESARLNHGDDGRDDPGFTSLVLRLTTS